MKAKRYKNFLKIIAVSLIVILFSLAFKDFNGVFYTIFDMLCLGYSFSLSIITLLKKKYNEKRYYRYIGIGFIFMCILNIIKITTGVNIFGLEYMHITYGIDMLACNFEIFIIAIALIGDYKDISENKILFIYFIVFSVSGLIVTMPCNECGVFNYKFSIIYILLSEAISISFLVYFIKYTFSKNKKPNLMYYYLLFIIIQQVMIIIGSKGNEISGYIQEIFRYYSYYIIYSLMEEEVLHNSHKQAKKRLESIQRTQKSLNVDLSRRNKTLIQMDNMIEKSEKRYGELIEAINDGIILFYFDKIYYINAAAMEIIGYKEYNNLMDMKFDTFVKNILYKRIMSGNFSEIFNKLKKTENKDKNEVKIELPPINGIQYEIYLINMDTVNKFIYIRNITEISKIHEYNRKYQEYLQLEDSKKDFYSNISHELRTPINLIYSAIQLTEMYIKDNNLRDIEKNNRTIKHNCLRLIRTINNFIDTNKISEGYLKPNFKVYNIVSIVENISLASNKYIKKVNNRLIFDSEEEEFYVRCDKDMIERSILNLLSNSVKFAKNNGTVYINISADEKKIYINIENSGYIVDDEVKPFLFDKFTKVNKSLHRIREGSGLGLYLTKALLELQGGTITIGKESKIGTEFLITLPRSYDSKACQIEENIEMNPLDEKVDIEFSDIYL